MRLYCRWHAEISLTHTQRIICHCHLLHIWIVAPKSSLYLSQWVSSNTGFSWSHTNTILERLKSLWPIPIYFSCPSDYKIIIMSYAKRGTCTSSGIIIIRGKKKLGTGGGVSGGGETGCLWTAPSNLSWIIDFAHFIDLVQSLSTCLSLVVHPFFHSSIISYKARKKKYSFFFKGRKSCIELLKGNI